MSTYFASEERLTHDEIKNQIELISNNPVVDGLMHVASGLMAVLNEHRQILSINHTLFQVLGIDNPEDVLGMRPGEALHCVHSTENNGGCGTSKYCSTCGAVIALVSSLETNEPQKGKCAISTEKRGEIQDLFFEVQAYPVEYDGHRFILLFLQDVTEQQKMAAIQHVFLHDLNNVLSGLDGISALLTKEPTYDTAHRAKMVNQISQRLIQEVAMQKCLSDIHSQKFQVAEQNFRVLDVFRALTSEFSEHPVAKDKHLVFTDVSDNIFLKSDMTVVLRVLGNMIKNAFEASDEGKYVKVGFEYKEGKYIFSVWNDAYIEEKIQLRMFQRNFSTKGDLGRGLGLYSIQLFGEKILGGEISFETDVDKGTFFRLTL
jgi:K+-sensing histidine kinase KdpD